MTLRHISKLRHLNGGWAYRGQCIRLYVVDEHVDVVTEDEELVAEIILNPEKNYQPIIWAPRTCDAQVRVSAMS